MSENENTSRKVISLNKGVTKRPSRVPAKSKQKLVGHDILLDSAMRNEKEVTLITMSEGLEIAGVITNFDKFTITMKTGDLIACYYKHAIESFSVKS